MDQLGLCNVYIHPAVIQARSRCKEEVPRKGFAACTQRAPVLRGIGRDSA